MFIEWDSPPPDAYSDEGYRAFIKDLHDKLTSAGTGITHMSEITGQFDLVSGVVPTLLANKCVKGQPLYYKFESIGKKTLYIHISFDVYYYSSTAYVKTILGYVKIYDTLNSAGIPENKTYLPLYGNTNRNAYNEYYNMSYSYYSDSDSSFRFSGGKSIIIVNDGTLVIQHCMGTKNSSIYDYNKSILSVMLETSIDDYSSIAQYNNDVAMYYGSITNTSSYYRLTFSGRAAMVYSWGYNKYNTGYVRSLSLTPTNSIIKISYINHKNGFSSFDKIYYYDSNLIVDEGVVLTIDGGNYYFLGDLIYDFSITSSETNVYGFAIRID